MPHRRLTNEDRIAIIQQIAAGTAVADVAAAFNLHESTIYNCLAKAKKDHPENTATEDEFAKIVAKASSQIKTPRKFTETFKRQIAQRVVDGESIATTIARASFAT